MFILGYQWVNSERRDKNAETAVYARFTGTRLYYALDFQKLNEGAYSVTPSFLQVMVGSGDQNFESWMRSIGKHTETSHWVRFNVPISHRITGGMRLRISIIIQKLELVLGQGSAYLCEIYASKLTTSFKS
ncbi:hypothetical protein HID58_081786 [Brassica napus]|uniref:F5/8 type C domain-containing protein n=1 Tax=Brassica napus TaxID=3708 RepID=A0ABQ7Y8P5_BRANA|nr:hypothetical protein HID58_081786 [Brassica napus]